MSKPLRRWAASIALAVAGATVVGVAPRGAGAAPPDDDAVRAALVGRVLDGTSAARADAIAKLLADDVSGAGFAAVVGAVAELEKRKDAPALVDVARQLGRPGLEKAVATLVGMLDAKDAELRATAAVSLEHVGSATAVGPLLARLDREKDDAVLLHLLRAVGRCGPFEERVRAALDRRASSGKTEALCCAAVIGLAHAKGDAATARLLEDHLTKVGPPGFGRRADKGVNSLKRVYLGWALATVGDPKSAAFVREKLVKPLEHVSGGPVVDAVIAFYVAVFDVCEGRRDAMAIVEAGAKTVLATYGNPLTAEARKHRAFSSYVPLAEW
ncbi:MAG: HEAT repeat domain-containing protein [Planctomycetota bacterium]